MTFMTLAHAEIGLLYAAIITQSLATGIAWGRLSARVTNIEKLLDRIEGRLFNHVKEDYEHAA